MFWQHLVFLTQIVFIISLSLVVSAVRYVSHKNCNNMKKGSIVTNPGNCSQYIICNGLRSTLGECPDGQYFNGDMLSCDKNPIQCEQKTSVTTVVSSSAINTASTNSISTTTSSLPTAILEEPLATICWSSL